MMQLIKFTCDYADEFDVHSFVVMDNKEVEKLFNLATLYFEVFPRKELGYYFGTNEELTFSDYKDFRNSFVVSNLTESESDTFIKLFPYYKSNSRFKAMFGYIGIFDKYLLVEKMIDDEENENAPHLLQEIKRIAPEAFSEIEYCNFILL